MRVHFLNDRRGGEHAYAGNLCGQGGRELGSGAQLWRWTAAARASDSTGWRGGVWGMSSGGRASVIAVSLLACAARMYSCRAAAAQA